MSSDLSISKPKLIAVVGPTASGKTSLSIALAKRFRGEIVSADSRQVYRGMDVGTAKAPISFEPISDMGEITKSRVPEFFSIGILKKISGIPVSKGQTSRTGHAFGIPHHLLDVRNPDEDYSLAEYQHDAARTIQEIVKRGNVPFLVGGTGLYVKSVVENLDIPKTKADPELRAKIEREIEDDGLPAVFKRLVDRDPEAAYIVDPKNPRRVVRALEVTLTSGIPFSAQRKKREPLFDALTLGISQPEEILKKRIDIRIDQMMTDGLVEEVKRLVDKYGKTPVAFDAIGYREIIDYLDGKLSLAAAVALMKSNTWHYAKRQMTWFKKDKTIRWIKNEKEAEEMIEEFL